MGKVGKFGPNCTAKHPEDSHFPMDGLPCTHSVVGGPRTLSFQNPGESHNTRPRDVAAVAVVIRLGMQER
jgi:hypothetical protein